MNFMQILKSLDELLYEVMSWLVFYPVTLWRTLRHPWQMMNYSDQEQKEQEERQYEDTVAPPLFLLLSLLLSHAIELAVIGESALIAETRGLAAYIDDDTSLIALRLVTFSIFPLVMATRLVRARRGGLTRETLKAPFFSQCYVAATFALAMGLAATLIQTHGDRALLVGLATGFVTLVWYIILQARWFSQHLDRGIASGVWHASLALVESLILVFLLAVLFA